MGSPSLSGVLPGFPHTRMRHTHTHTHIPVMLLGPVLSGQWEFSASVLSSWNMKDFLNIFFSPKPRLWVHLAPWISYLSSLTESGEPLFSIAFLMQYLFTVLLKCPVRHICVHLQSHYAECEAVSYSKNKNQWMNKYTCTDRAVEPEGAGFFVSHILMRVPDWIVSFCIFTLIIVMERCRLHTSMFTFHVLSSYTPCLAASVRIRRSWEWYAFFKPYPLAWELWFQAPEVLRNETIYAVPCWVLPLPSEWRANYATPYEPVKVSFWQGRGTFHCSAAFKLLLTCTVMILNC